LTFRTSLYGFLLNAFIFLALSRQRLWCFAIDKGLVIYKERIDTYSSSAHISDTVDSRKSELKQNHQCSVDRKEGRRGWKKKRRTNKECKENSVWCNRFKL